MDKREALLKLAELVEDASEPNRELDAEIFHAIGMPLPTSFAGMPVELAYDEAQRAFVMAVGEMQVRYEHPEYTFSLDAALQLVPEGARWNVETLADSAVSHVWRYHPLKTTGPIFAATPALTLTAASLRAIAAQEQG